MQHTSAPFSAHCGRPVYYLPILELTPYLSVVVVRTLLFVGSCRKEAVLISHRYSTISSSTDSFLPRVKSHPESSRNTGFLFFWVALMSSGFLHNWTSMVSRRRAGLTMDEADISGVYSPERLKRTLALLFLHEGNSRPGTKQIIPVCRPMIMRKWLVTHKIM